MHSDKSGANLLLVATTAVKVVMKTLAVTACGGTASIMKSSKG